MLSDCQNFNRLTGYRGRREDHGKPFTATFRAGVILRMRRELRGRKWAFQVAIN